MLKKNLSFSTITTSSRLVSGFFLIFVLARLLPIEDFGKFTYSLVFSNILVLIIEYGYSLKLSKDTAFNINNISSLTWNSFKVKIYLTAFVALILLILFILKYPDKQLINIIIILTFSSAFNSLANHFLIPYRSLNRFEVETKFAFINNLILFTIVFFVTFFSKNILFIASAFLSVKVIYCTLTINKFINDFGFKSERINLRSEIQDGLPYAIHIGVGSILLNIDTVILKEFVSDTEIGIYQAGMRALGACTIGLGILNSVLIPKLSNLIENDKQKLLSVSTKLNYLSILLGGSIAIFINIFSDQLIYIIYGEEFAELSEYVFYFSIIIFLRYLSVLYGAILTISNLQKIRTYCVSFALILILFLDLFMIPKYKINGALYVLIVAHIILLICYFFYSYKSYKSTFLNFKYVK